MHSSVAVGTFLLAGTLVTLVGVGVHSVKRRAGKSETEARRAALKMVAAQLVWLLVTGAAAAGGLFADFNEVPPKLPLVLLVCLVLLIRFSRTGQNARIIHFAPLAWPIAIQSMRVIIEIGLWQLHRDGLVPKHMTFEGHNFDILVGLTAPVVAYGLSQGWISTRAATLWNFASIGFLVAIVFMAITSAPGPAHLNWPGVPNTALALFPTVWLPTFFVPLAIFGHATSLRQLFRVNSAPISHRDSVKL
jgi:hypothetical protein